MLDILLLIFFLETNKPSDTFVMPVAKTYPEERHVLEAYPVIPVEITTIN